MQIHSLRALSDNTIHIFVEGETCYVVDPGESAPVKKFLKEKGLSLTALLITHHHSDHIDGVEELHAPQIFGPQEPRLPFPVKRDPPPGFTLLQLPGHTKTHIGFYHPAHKLLFCGDVLFGGGCGRVFEGTYSEMWESLKKIRALPDETRLFFGHDYTRKNLEFALSLLPGDETLLRRLEENPESTIALEKKTNLFLRADDPEFAQALDLTGKTPLEIFSFLREARNRF